MVNVYISVMNYSSATIQMYVVQLEADYQSEDVESWLYNNTDYNDSTCYYMSSTKPIDVEYN